MAFQMSIIAIGSLILQYVLNGLGSVSVAAYTAAQKIDSIATMPMNSFGAPWPPTQLRITVPENPTGSAAVSSSAF